MPTVAQKLCHDIVEPVLKQSSTDADIVKSTIKSNNSLNKRQNYNFSRVYVEKKSSNKIKTIPGGTTITKSKISILKKFAETGINTLASGTLKCDNNCVTLLRKRDFQTSCKCGQKRKNVKGSSKSIQTLNKIRYSLTDKAITNCVETVTCGTQFIGKSNCIDKNSTIIKTNTPLKLPGNARDMKARIVSAQCPHIAQKSFQNKFDNSMMPTLRYVGAKHWALSRYPTRGPDF